MRPQKHFSDAVAPLREALEEHREARKHCFGGLDTVGPLVSTSSIQPEYYVHPCPFGNARVAVPSTVHRRRR